MVNWILERMALDWMIKYEWVWGVQGFEGFFDRCALRKDLWKWLSFGLVEFE